MYKLLLLLLPAAATTACAQTTQPKKTATKTASKKVEIPLEVRTFSKEAYGDSMFRMSETVEVENGHRETVEVQFNGLIERRIWKEFAKADPEWKAFKLLCWQLTDSAQLQLEREGKNALSFEPFKKQYFDYKPETGWFLCEYTSMTRNDNGIMVETSVVVRLRWPKPL